VSFWNLVLYNNNSVLFWVFRLLRSILRYFLNHLWLVDVFFLVFPALSLTIMTTFLLWKFWIKWKDNWLMRLHLPFEYHIGNMSRYVLKQYTNPTDRSGPTLGGYWVKLRINLTIGTLIILVITSIFSLWKSITQFQDLIQCVQIINCKMTTFMLNLLNATTFDGYLFWFL